MRDALRFPYRDEPQYKYSYGKGGLNFDSLYEPGASVTSAFKNFNILIGKKMCITYFLKQKLVEGMKIKPSNATIFSFLFEDLE
jgi:hypothetical protein